MTDPHGARVGIHGVRSAWLGDILEDGWSRPDSATFVLSRREIAEDVGLRTLTMAIFHALSLSTLRMWCLDPPDSLAEWYSHRRDRLPAVALATAHDAWRYVPSMAWNRYYVRLDGCQGYTAPYATVSAGAAVGPDEIIGALEVTPDDVEVTERKACARLAGHDLPDEPFFFKTPDEPLPTALEAAVLGGCPTVGVAPVGMPHTWPVLSAPVVCLGLANLLLPKVESLIAERVLS